MMSTAEKRTHRHRPASTRIASTILIPAAHTLGLMEPPTPSRTSGDPAGRQPTLVGSNETGVCTRISAHHCHLQSTLLSTLRPAWKSPREHTNLNAVIDYAHSAPFRHQFSLVFTEHSLFDPVKRGAALAAAARTVNVSTSNLASFNDTIAREQCLCQMRKQ